ncbi:MAG: PHP domain-containing protein [Dehalococcoidales bacterium]|nr:PHP domain-containing protein [Dehalococcoidales bacterium]
MTDHNLVDLHLHTTASDGTDAPAEVVRKARDLGLRVIAITDHDSTEGVAEAVASARGTDLEVIPGIEISTDVPLGEIHILGYFVDVADGELQNMLHLLRESRHGRARRMVDKLRDLGMDIDWERVKAFAGEGAVGRPHVARAMVEKGYVSTTAEAFDRYIGRNGPAYVERYKLTPPEAVQLVLGAKGLPGLAHPVIAGAAEPLGDSPDLEPLLAELSQAGLVAMECYYTGYTDDITADLLEKARRYNLVPTGGSDYHGANLVGPTLGGVHVPLSSVEALRERLREK